MRRIASRSTIVATLGIALWIGGSTASARDRLYTLGPERLLIDADGHARRFRTVPAEPPWQGTFARFRTDDDLFALSGADGRYRIADASGTVRELRILQASDTGTTRAVHADCPSECDGRTTPPADFDRTPSSIGAIRLDLRPASCRSYFIDFPPIERGARIETAIAEHPRFVAHAPTVRSFPSIDLIGEHDMIMLRSLDLSAAGVSGSSGQNGVYDEILADVERLDGAVLAPLRDGATLELRDGTDVTRLTSGREAVYTLIVRHGVLDEPQAAEIRRARNEIARRFGVRLDVIEIP